MSLAPEWRRRIESWKNSLADRFYRPLADVTFEGFVTAEQLTPAEAARGPFRPMKPGTKWGGKWEYGWFRARVKLPAEARGQRVELRPYVGWHSVVFVDGTARGQIDEQHKQVTLTRRARGGEVFDVLVEGYAGHGPWVCSIGPVAPDVTPVPEPPPTQQAVGASSIGVWREDAFQLWMDVTTLLELRDRLDPDSLRVAEIDAGLRDFTLLCDLERPWEQAVPTVRAARRRLQPLLACRNGSSAPLLYCFGHSHIDVAWLWPLQETERKCARTFSGQLALMEDYPEYKFLQSQPHTYRMAKRCYPELYARIKQAVKRGQFVPDGGMWVEADTNITGGESLIRQFLHGKRFYREEFGVESEMMWLPDVFGYSGAMPQIMAGCGIKYFATAKIFWNYDGGDTFPYNTFWWEGIDGTRILAHMMNDYNSETRPGHVIQRWKERVQKDGISSRLMPFGYGDGGGGPTRVHLEYLRRMRDLQGVPRTTMAAPTDFFRAEEKRGASLPVYVGELYFQAHRGTYTSQARTKRGNRQCELGLREAEMWSSAAVALKGWTFPAKAMDEAWKLVLLNQFHDIIPGSSIQRVYEESRAQHAAVLRTARDVAAKAAGRFVRKAKGAVTVFNSLSWARPALVALPAGAAGAEDAAGNALPVQRIGAARYAEVPAVPSCGWTTIRVADRAPAPAAGPMRATPATLENDRLSVRFNAAGEIDSIVDKETGRAMNAGPCNSLRMYRDIPCGWDAWDIVRIYKQEPVDLARDAQISVHAAGPLAVALKIRRVLNESPMTQIVTLRRGSRRLDFDTRIDWKESHKVLKVNFPFALRAENVMHEIQFGYLHRPTHQSRVYDADRFEVSAHKWSALVEPGRGCAVLNDCKYGVNVEGNSINLTLLRSPRVPDATADVARHEFTYSFYGWNGGFAECDLVRQAYDLNVPVRTAEGDGGEQSLFQLDAANVVIDTVKPAEDGSGDIVVRLYESKGMGTTCALRTALPVKRAAEANMLETALRPLRMKSGAFALTFTPFQIRTVRLG